MMSIRSLADFNGSSPGRCSDWLGTATVTARGLNLRDDTTNEGWGLLPGHHRGPPPGHTRGLSHGHGQTGSYMHWECDFARGKCCLHLPPHALSTDDDLSHASNW